MLLVFLQFPRLQLLHRRLLLPRYKPHQQLYRVWLERVGWIIGSFATKKLYTKLGSFDMNEDILFSIGTIEPQNSSKSRTTCTGNCSAVLMLSIWTRTRCRNFWGGSCIERSHSKSHTTMTVTLTTHLYLIVRLCVTSTWIEKSALRLMKSTTIC